MNLCILRYNTWLIEMVTHTTLTENIKLMISRGRGCDKGYGHTPNMITRRRVHTLPLRGVRLALMVFIFVFFPLLVVLVLLLLLPSSPFKKYIFFALIFFFLYIGEWVFWFTLQSKGGGNEPNRCLPTANETTQEEDQIKKKKTCQRLELDVVCSA